MNKSDEYEASIRVKKKATKEDAQRLNIKVGEEYTIIPKPKSKAEMFERFKKLDAQRFFEVLIAMFNRKYGNASQKVIEDELNQINNFISEANQLTTTETFKNEYVFDRYKSDLSEYSRLANGYYDNPNKPFLAYGYYNNNASMVYAKYFLFKSWLEKKLKGYKSKTVLDESFLEQLRTFYGIMNWVFEDEKVEIVPKEFTHEYLQQNNPIGSNILKYYYLPTGRFFSDKEYKKMVDSGYIGNKETTLSPYPFIMYGAYFGRIDLYTKLSEIVYIEDKPFLNGNNDLRYFEDLIPYFEEYAEGFRDGYENFEQICIEKYLTKFADKEDYISKVHEYITKRILFEHDWLNNHSGFKIQHANEPKAGRIVDAFEDGQKQGYFYRAWTIVFCSSQLFEPLFTETIEARNISANIQTKSDSNKDENNDVTFINNFDQVEPKRVYDYFFNTLVEQKHIDENTLQDYLISAFQNKKIPKQRITIKNKSTNKKVQEIFYNYYKDVAGKPYGKQQSYIELLGNYFVGFDTKKLKTNFSKTY